MKRLLLLILCALTACALAVKGQSVSRPLRAEMPAGQRFGQLTLLGAVEWTADRPDFGGFSALALQPDGAFIALTDKAHWARARMVHDGQGHLTAIDGLKVGRLYGPDGTYLQRPFMDSEALTRAPDGSWLISFEAEHRISRFADLTAPEQPLPVQPDLGALRNNGGLESLLSLPDGRIIAVAEDGTDWTRGFQGWIINGERIESFSIARDGWFLPVDLAIGPDGGTLYLLERRFTLIGGVATRLRRFPAHALKPGATITGETLFTSPPSLPLDNMEGLAVKRGDAGETLLYMISDDNFNALQRTLITQFRVAD